MLHSFDRLIFKSFVFDSTFYYPHEVEGFFTILDSSVVVAIITNPSPNSDDTLSCVIDFSLTTTDCLKRFISSKLIEYPIVASSTTRLFDPMGWSNSISSPKKSGGMILFGLTLAVMVRTQLQIGFIVLLGNTHPVS